MDDLKTITIKRINIMDLNILCDMIDKFTNYGVNFYDSKGKFDFDKFRSRCIKTATILYQHDTPVNGIRYQLCDFLSAVETIVGKRSFADFMSQSK